MTFKIHEEAPFPGATAVLRQWLPEADASLRSILGSVGGSEDVHVVLSTSQRHERRFPPRSELLQALFSQAELQELDPPEAGNGASPLQALYEARLYLHGVTVVATAEHAFPAAVPVGADVIALDLPTIMRISEELGVPAEAMLARVALHELSHVRRQHARSPRAGTTHGYIREGDAQRDAWETLGLLLNDADVGNVARNGRRAQARLAAERIPQLRPHKLGSPSVAGTPPDLTSQLACTASQESAAPQRAPARRSRRHGGPCALSGRPRLPD